MSKESLLLAKVAALKKNFDIISFNGGRCLGQSIEHLFPIYVNVVSELREANPNLYSDVPEVTLPTSIGSSQNGKLFAKHDIEPLVNNLEFILELQSNSRIGDKFQEREKKRKVFISHGKCLEWHKVQAYLEKDLGLESLELAQEPNLGRTVLQKLSEESEKCSVAVIIMTGDDLTAEGEIRTRENVMHEIGFFQGKYGLHNVVLLHESGVNIPSNIQGLVYIPFPKQAVEAAHGALFRELKTIIA